MSKRLSGEVFVRAGSRFTEAILREAKGSSDKAERLLRELECKG